MLAAGVVVGAVGELGGELDGDGDATVLGAAVGSAEELDGELDGDGDAAVLGTAVGWVEELAMMLLEAAGAELDVTLANVLEAAEPDADEAAAVTLAGIQLVSVTSHAAPHVSQVQSE